MAPFLWIDVLNRVGLAGSNLAAIGNNSFLLKGVQFLRVAFARPLSGVGEFFLLAVDLRGFRIRGQQTFEIGEALQLHRRLLLFLSTFRLAAHIQMTDGYVAFEITDRGETIFDISPGVDPPFSVQVADATLMGGFLGAV